MIPGLLQTPSYAATVIEERSRSSWSSRPPRG
ncbi:hypothetical protein [Streptomyces hydrogenans]